MFDMSLVYLIPCMTGLWLQSFTEYFTSQKAETLFSLSLGCVLRDWSAIDEHE